MICTCYLYSLCLTGVIYHLNPILLNCINSWKRCVVSLKGNTQICVIIYLCRQSKWINCRKMQGGFCIDASDRNLEVHLKNLAKSSASKHFFVFNLSWPTSWSLFWAIEKNFKFHDYLDFKNLAESTVKVLLYKIHFVNLTAFFWRRFQWHSPAGYWVITPKRWLKFPLKSMVISNFLKFFMVKLFKNLHNVVDVDTLLLINSDKNIWINQHPSIFNLDFNLKLSVILSP